jgi:hypothetical protein
MNSATLTFAVLRGVIPNNLCPALQHELAFLFHFWPCLFPHWVLRFS